jgi:hypothetical protein
MTPSLVQPNARPELLPKAGAQRTLEAVSSRPLLGMRWFRILDASHSDSGWQLRQLAKPRVRLRRHEFTRFVKASGIA